MKILKNKTLFGIMIGLVIGSIGVVIADYALKASDIEYTNKQGNKTNVQTAITDLYDKATTELVQKIGYASGATIEGVNSDGQQLDASGNVVTDGEDNPITVTHYGIVYLDPTDLSKACDANAYQTNLNAYYASNGNLKATKRDGTKVATSTGLKTGCMKWYVYDKNEDGSLDLILDHNTTPRVSWVNEIDYKAVGGTNWDLNGANDKGPVTISKELALLTADSNIVTGGSNWKVEPRMITADEIAHIVGADRNDTIKWSSSKPYGTTIDTQSSWFYLDGGRNDNPTVYASSSNGWRKQYADSDKISNYAWLYDYTVCVYNNGNGDGCAVGDRNKYNYVDIEYVVGYWTSTKVNSNTDSFNAWNVTSDGKLEDSHTNYSSLGLRPVITITK